MVPRHLFANAITALEVGCVAGILGFGALILPAESARHAARSTSTPEELAHAPAGNAIAEPATVRADRECADELSDRRIVLAHEEGDASARTPCSAPTSDGPALWERAAPVEAERRTERDYYRAFARLGAQSTADLELAARTALGSSGPDCEKVAALRAVADVRSPAAIDLLADAVATLPDVSRAAGDSVPRFALRVLVEKAARDERARRALERVAWNRSVSEALRSAAVIGLAAVADEAGGWRIVSALEIEQDARLRETAACALARNSATQSAAAAAAQWIPAPSDGAEPR